LAGGFCIIDQASGRQRRFHPGETNEQVPIPPLLQAKPLREPFLLQTLGGFSCNEIAGMLETSEGAVMVRLTRARQALRGMLEGTGKSAAKGGTRGGK
jgi:hypothetical protein